MAESFNLKLAPLEVISEIVKFVDFRTYPNLLEATATSPGLQVPNFHLSHPVAIHIADHRMPLTKRLMAVNGTGCTGRNRET